MCARACAWGVHVCVLACLRLVKPGKTNCHLLTRSGLSVLRFYDLTERINMKYKWLSGSCHLHYANHGNPSTLLVKMQNSQTTNSLIKFQCDAIFSYTLNKKTFKLQKYEAKAYLKILHGQLLASRLPLTLHTPSYLHPGYNPRESALFKNHLL